MNAIHAGTVALVATLLAGCAVSPERDETFGVDRAAITSASVDDGDAAVAALRKHGVVTCTGTLIAKRYVLTAAHCVALGRPDEVVFRGGEGSEERVGVTHAFAHPNFDPTTLASDIAVVELAREASARPVAWAAREIAIAPKEHVRVSGFGAASGVVDDRAQPATALASMVKRSGTSLVLDVTPTEITVAPAPSQPCRGDSGGPMFALGEEGEVLVGVVSEGDGACARYARATRVEAFADFVGATIEPPPSPSGCAVARTPARSFDLTGGLALACLVAACVGRRWRRTPPWQSHRAFVSPRRALALRAARTRPASIAP